MKATVLADNIGSENLPGEWGLSIYIEAAELNILLDCGASSLYRQNAESLGLEIAAVDLAVLSHAHYDHADGMADFFQHNQKAKFYLQSAAAENCYKIEEGEYKYIGMPANILKDFAPRIQQVNGPFQLAEGVWLLPHTTPGLAEAGRQANMFQLCNDEWQPDNFAHEQSLVFERPEGLVVFNSCSHGGVLNITHEAEEQLSRPVRQMIGGFHLYQQTPQQVQALAEQLCQAGLTGIHTGHCTGDEAFAILQQKLGPAVQQLRVGLEIEF